MRPVTMDSSVERGVEAEGLLWLYDKRKGRPEDNPTFKVMY